jgi:hypothetical protein
MAALMSVLRRAAASVFVQMAITCPVYHPFLPLLGKYRGVPGAAGDDLAKKQLKCRQKLTIA